MTKILNCIPFLNFIIFFILWFEIRIRMTLRIHNKLIIIFVNMLKKNYLFFTSYKFAVTVRIKCYLSFYTILTRFLRKFCETGCSLLEWLTSNIFTILFIEIVRITLFSNIIFFDIVKSNWWKTAITIRFESFKFENKLLL